MGTLLVIFLTFSKKFPEIAIFAFKVKRISESHQKANTYNSILAASEGFLEIDGVKFSFLSGILFPFLSNQRRTEILPNIYYKIEEIVSYDRASLAT